jgi:hypothetical protein
MARTNFDAGSNVRGTDNATGDDSDVSDGQTEGDRPDPTESQGAWDEALADAVEERAGEDAARTTLLVRVDAWDADTAVPDGEVHVLAPGGKMSSSIRSGARFERFNFIVGRRRDIEVIATTDAGDVRNIVTVEPGDTKQVTLDVQTDADMTARDPQEVHETQERIDVDGNEPGPEDFVTDAERAPEWSEFGDSSGDDDPDPVADGGTAVIGITDTSGASGFDGFAIVGLMLAALYAVWQVVS